VDSGKFDASDACHISVHENAVGARFCDRTSRIKHSTKWVNCLVSQIDLDEVSLLRIKETRSSQCVAIVAVE
jgi:hypothetical protein